MQHLAILRRRATAPALFIVCAALAVAFGACVSTDTLPTPAEARIPTSAGEGAPTPTAAVSALVPSSSPTPTAAVSALVPSSSPTPTAAVSALVPTPVVEPCDGCNAYGVAVDASYADGLAHLSTRVWETDFRFHTVPYEEVISGGVGRDGIPPIDDPRFVSVTEANEWLADAEPVIALELNGEAKAYPLQVLTRHEIVNDELGGVPVSATYCPLCNSAVVFDRTLDGTVYDFGVSGNLRNSDLVMWDRQTQSWWQQLTGEAIAGELAGAQLRFVPAQIVSWATFAAEHLDGLTLAPSGFSSRYGTNPYVNYDNPDSQPFLFRGEADRRLPPKLRVAAVEINGEAVAFPYSRLAQERVVHHRVGGEEIVVFFEFGTTSAIGARSIPDAEDVGATGVFRPTLDSERLTFVSDGNAITDQGTGSLWNVLGRAVSGPLAGRQLERVNAQDHLWFAWAAFKPHTTVYGEP
ncbi:MAG: DUF3179 domain-containing (seleno)protein [Chloroflexota bacterium]|nr:DUF3179 domain-containing (seleno)protein [Chloroflexota bacterium]MDE2886466.1 DUF3179 domain-containing (seleno)protein [Chloroflexota bacterium]